MTSPSKTRDVFAQNLKNLRIEAELSQERLSKLAGLGRNVVGRIERDAPNVRLDTVAKLAAVLKVDECVLVSTRPFGNTKQEDRPPVGDRVAANLKSLRGRRRVSQEQLSEAASLARNAIYKLESLQFQATLNTLDAIAEALDAPAWMLLA